MKLIELAKKWGYWDGNTAEFNDVGLEMFAKAIKQHLEYDSLHTCHNECPRPLCVQLRKAVQAEREACAKVVENYALQYAEPVWALKLTEAIRARGEK